MKLSLVHVDGALSLPEVEAALQDLETAQGSLLGIAVCFAANLELSIAVIDVARPRQKPARTLKLVEAAKPKPDGFELIAFGTCIVSNVGAQVALYGK